MRFGLRSDMAFIPLFLSLLPTLSVADVGARGDDMAILNSSSTTSSFPRSLQENCNDMVAHGDFNGGTYSGWTAHDDVGTLMLYPDSVSGDAGDMSLLHTGRTVSSTGPEHLLDIRCFRQAGDRFTVTAYVKLKRGDRGFVCDRTASGGDAACPVVTLQTVQPDGRRHYSYGVNTVTKEWKEGGWNEFHAYIDVNEKVAAALEINMYFERVPENVDMLLDHVKVTEMVITGDLEDIGIKDALEFNETDIYAKNNYEHNNLNCTHMVLNGDAEEGDTRGWSSRIGGKIFRYPDGYAGQGMALIHTARSSFIMGPQHTLASSCMVEGKGYDFQAQMKLLDENGDPFVCSKEHKWADDAACPLLTVQYTHGGKDYWDYFENTHPDPWVADQYNLYLAPFTVSQKLRESTDAFFYFERVKAGVSIVWDQVSIDRDCTSLIPNGDADSFSTLGWQASDGIGPINVHNHTDLEAVERPMNDLVSHAYFSHTNRKGVQSGPRNNFDVHCLLEDRAYEVSVYIKLANSTTGEVAVCNKYAKWYNPAFCPLLSLGMTLADGTHKVINLGNDHQDADSKDWKPEFNFYHTVINVDEELSSARSAYLYIKGPPSGIDILFDDLQMGLYFPEERGCKEIVYNGDGEKGIVEWTTSGGTVQRFEDGNNGTTAVAHYGRTEYTNSLHHKIDPSCLVEGTHYVLKAHIKLFDESMQPYRCNRLASYGDDDYCALVSLYVVLPNGITPIHIPNGSPTDWNATEWNVYRADFVVDVNLAQAKSAQIMLRGPKAGVTLVVDDLSIEKYVPPVRGCDELLANNDLEDFDMNAWEAYGGATRLNDGGSFSSASAILHFNRPSRTSGMKQKIDTSCLVEKKMYQFSAHFQLFNETGGAFYCDCDAKWGDIDYCMILGVHYKIGNAKEKVLYFTNGFPSGWVAEEFNFFSTVVTIPAELSMATEAYIVIKGPRAGVSILSDMIEFKEYTPPTRKCGQMIRNPNAEAGDLMGWSSYMGGYFSFYEYEQGKIAYKYYSRKKIQSGPRQYLDTSCFQARMKYELDGLFRLLLGDEPLGCDKEAPWRDARYCLLATIEYLPKRGKVKRLHVGNSYSRPWQKDKWNTFRGAFLVPADLEGARSAFIYFQGLRASASIVFDHITLTALKVVS